MRKSICTSPLRTGLQIAVTLIPWIISSGRGLRVPSSLQGEDHIDGAAERTSRAMLVRAPTKWDKQSDWWIQKTTKCRCCWQWWPYYQLWCNIIVTKLRLLIQRTKVTNNWKNNHFSFISSSNPRLNQMLTRFFDFLNKIGLKYGICIQITQLFVKTCNMA